MSWRILFDALIAPIAQPGENMTDPCNHCDQPADGVDGKCFFHSQDELGAAGEVLERWGTAHNAMDNYLRQIVFARRTFYPNLPPGYHYWCVEDYVMDRGQPFESAPLTPDELLVLLTAIDACPEPCTKRKECFFNAQVLMLSDPSGTLEYAEGIAIGPSGFAVHHGWVVLNGKVVDLTLRTAKRNHAGRLRDRVFGVIPAGWQYRGVLIDREICQLLASLDGWVGTIIDDRRQGHALYRQPRLSPCPVGRGGAHGEPMPRARPKKN